MSDRLPAVSADVPVLTADQLEALPADLRDAYVAALVQELEESPLTEPQMRAHDLCNRVDELLYGGSAGGGKSHFAIWHTDRLSRVYPGHRTLILRTSLPELRRTLMAKAHELIDKKAEPGVTWRAADKEWHYGNGSVIEFGYCVAGETPIRMGDGSYKRMDLIEAGEFVDTLEGPRMVKRHFHVGVKPSVKMTTASGASVVASQSHAVLSAGGQWLPPCGPDGAPTPDLLGLSSQAPTGGSDRVGDLPLSATRPGLRRTLRAVAESLGLAALRATGASVGGVRSSDGSLTDPPRASERPRQWFAHLTLHGPAALSADRWRSGDDRCDALRGPTGPRVPGWTVRCSCGCDPCGGPARWAPTADPTRTPSRGGVGTLAQPMTPEGDLGCTPSRSQQERSSYSHPYTSERRGLAVAVHHAPVHIAPVDDADLWDMSIEGANHYVSWGGIIHKNCESIEDVRQYLSAEYECIVIDESTDMLGEWIEMVRTRLRTTKQMRALGVNPHLLLLTNPGGIGHVYHRDRYVRTTNNGEYVAELDERDERGRGRLRTVAFVPARVSDNPHIDPDYESNLVAIKDPVRRAQYLDGDWSVNEGTFFSEFRTDIHVIEPFEIRPEWAWPLIGGYDWGFAAPACLLLGAVDQDRRIHIFREMYVERHTAADQARIFRSWGIKPDYIAADPSIWRETGVGQPVSRQLMNAGMMPLRKANNDRIAGWNAVREALALDPDTGLPGLVIHSHCENLIRELSDLPRDKKKPEDADTRAPDHSADALRYLVMSRARAAKSLMRRHKTYDERVSEAVTGSVSGRRRVHDVLGAI